MMIMLPQMLSVQGYDDCLAMGGAEPIVWVCGRKWYVFWYICYCLE